MNGDRVILVIYPDTLTVRAAIAAGLYAQLTDLCPTMTFEVKPLPELPEIDIRALMREESEIPKVIPRPGTKAARYAAKPWRKR